MADAYFSPVFMRNATAYGFSKMLRIDLKYYEERPVIAGLERVSLSSRRVYVKAHEIPRVRGGMGIAIISTSNGLMTDRDARKQNLGGEVVCFVW